MTKKIAQKPMLSLIGVFPNSLKCICFDFDDPTTHLGDRLFFFPLIAQLNKMGFSLSISSADKITGPIFSELYGANPFVSVDDQVVDLAVIAKPSFMNKRTLYKSLLVVDFIDSEITAPITASLVKNFSELFNLHISAPDVPLSKAASSSLQPIVLASDQSYYLFSNYINSGIFRKWFLDENKLQLKCLEKKNQGHKIIHVGSDQDKLNDKKSYSFVDLDLRGKLSLVQLISLLASPQVMGSITYDNFLMHLTGLFKKKAFVLFRGRFTKSVRTHHYKHVNNTCFPKGKEPHYL